uniref:Uncharacterized protein n=1 Tax=viral metagenome TaxID=1070528 RepID=A0A6C0HE11_9ZZZZ
MSENEEDSSNNQGSITKPLDFSNSEQENSQNKQGMIQEKEQEQEQEPQKEEENDNESLYLGDRISINTTKYGKVTGTIYYVNNDLLKILPDGVSDRLYNFPLQDGEFDPDLGILSDSNGEPDIILLTKGHQLGFIDTHSFRVGQVLDGIDNTGETIARYEIIQINSKDNNDKAILENTETKEQITIDFQEKGIPHELPFIILRTSAQVQQQEVQVPPQSEEQITQENQEDEVIEEGELAGIALVEEINKEERIYPELTQKSELYSDLLSSVPIESQKNPKIIKKIRFIVEIISSIKNSIIKRKIDGSIEGQEQISLQSLEDLFSEQRNVPIARPILNTKRIVTSTKKNELIGEQYIVNNLYTLIIKSNQILEKQGDIPVGEPGIGLPRWHIVLNKYFSNYPLGDQYTTNGTAFSTDAEYFRSFPPGSKELQGLLNLPKEVFSNKKGDDIEPENYPEDFTGKIDQSLRRGHGPTLRSSLKGGSEISISADKAEVKGHLLFPYKSLLSGNIGPTRFGSLWESILRSHMTNADKFKDMKKIISTFKGDKDKKDAQKITYLDKSTNSYVTTTFSDYFQLLLQNIVTLGHADIKPLKFDLGIYELELNVDQERILYERIDENIASIRTIIHNKRKSLVPTNSFTLNPIFKDNIFNNNIKSIIESYPTFQKLYRQLESQSPNYKDIDISIFSFLYMHAKDYLLSILSKDQNSITIEMNNFARDELTKQLYYAEKINQLERERGFPPVPNPCEHTDALTIIRKIKDDVQRIIALSKFLNMYKGDREENWINCSVCDQHLLCHHELLQIQQYLHPKEKDTIQKEIVLGYAGGTFGRNHICRNCGLPIAEMEFDTSIEFDDNGKPLMGRSELVDQDQKDFEELEKLLSGGSIRKYEEINFPNKIQNECYKIATILCDTLGIELSGPSYKNLVERAEVSIQSRIASEKRFEEEYKKSKKPYNQKQYFYYVTRNKIAIVSALVLLDIQTHTPDYIVRYIIEGCKAGFSGYPLIADAKPESKDDSIGIHYMVCALVQFIPNFKKDSDLDKLFEYGFHTISKKDDREKFIYESILKSINYILEHDGKIQQELESKRKYISKLYGSLTSSGRPGEKLPFNFLPKIESVEESAENAAKEPTVAEGVKKQGQERQAFAWIRQVHKYARENALIIKGNPYAETTCCTNSLLEPGSFWKKVQLPELPGYYSPKPSFTRQSILYTLFTARELHESIPEPSLELAYRVYLQICWKGPRIGLAHEIGYDHKCDWCDIEIPQEYLYPDVYLEDPTWKKKKIQEEMEKKELEEKQLVDNIILDFNGRQGIPCTDPIAFQELLDASHTRTRFKKYIRPLVTEPTQFIDEIISISTPPVENFTIAIQTGMNNLLTAGSDPVSIANALKPIRSTIEEGQHKLKEIFDTDYFNIIESMLQESPEGIIEIIRSYFLYPMQRIQYKYEIEKASSVPQQYKKGTRDKLSEQHIQEISDMLANHISYLRNSERQEGQELDELLLNNLNIYTNKVTSMLQFSSELRISRLFFDKKLSQIQVESFLNEILRCTLIGPLYILLHSIENNMNIFIVNIIEKLLKQYNREHLSYNPTKVREELAKAREVEKQGFIHFLHVKNPEERAIEIQKERLGIGRWSIGGTKLVYSYDPDQWDKFRSEHANNYSLLNDGVNGIPHISQQEQGYDTFGGDGNDNDGADD